MIPSGSSLSPTNLYYIYMELEYSKITIVFNIDDFVFLTRFIIIPPNLRSRPNTGGLGMPGIFCLKDQINSRSFGEKSKPISYFVWIL